LVVFSKTGAVLYGPVNTNTIFAGLGGGCEINNDGDAVTRYDRAADRFVVTQFSWTAPYPYAECIAVSASNDPTKAWNRYEFQDFGDKLPDYPKLSVWPDAYYMTYNLFTGGTTWYAPKFCAYDRARMLTGAAATQHCFTLASKYGGDLAADLESMTPPSAGAPEIFMEFGTNVLTYWKMHVDWSTPANTTLSSPTDIAVAPFSMACNGATCIPQKGTSQQLDSLGDRLMQRLIYRKYADHEAIFASHSVGAGSSTGVRWYELRDMTALNVFQTNTFAPDASFRWMPAIAADQNGNIAIQYSASSSTLNPGIRFTGRLATDALNSMQAETTFFTGGGSQTGGLSRWGDYAALTIDPRDDCTFWLANEYIPANGSFNWQTRIGSFKFPTCGPDFSISASPASSSAAQGGSTAYTVSTAVTKGSAFPVTFSASGLPAGATATFNPTSVPAGSSSTMTVSVGINTAPGTYTLTVTGAQTGGSTHAVQVTLTVIQNLVANPGFESGSASWNLVPQATVDTNPANAHSGTNSLKLVATGAWQGSSQFTPVTAGQAYAFSGWGKSSSGGGDFTLISYIANGVEVGSHLDVPFNGIGSWAQVAATYVPPTGTVQVGIYPQSSGAGTYWFDDLTLSPTGNLVANPSFEMGSVAWNLVPQAVIDATAANAHSFTNSLKLIATGAWQGSSQFIPVTAGQPYAFSGWGKSSSGGGDFTLISYIANGVEVGSHLDVTFPGAGIWVQVAATYVPPLGAVQVGIYPQSSGAGTYWFDDLTLSPTSNLIANPGFEMGSAGWNFVPQAVIDATAANARSGANSLKLIATGPWQGSYQIIPVTASQSYAFSGWGKSSSAGGDYTLISFDINGLQVGSHLDVPFNGTGSWVQVVATYTPPIGTVKVAIFPQSSGAGTYWFDDLSLQ
jgi:hypothetical protein